MKAVYKLLRNVTAPMLPALLALNAQATIFMYDATLTGPNESPPNASPGTGLAFVNYDSVAHTLQVQFSFSGLTGTTTASHIHAATTLPGTGTAGVATPTPFFPGFVTGVTSGSYSNTLDLTLTSSFNSSYVTANGGSAAGAEAALASALAADEAYLNIHTTTFGGGEIRGFLVAVPEPSSLVLTGLGGCAVIWGLRRRKAS
jgi:hypothetical protein